MNCVVCELYFNKTIFKINTIYNSIKITTASCKDTYKQVVSPGVGTTRFHEGLPLLDSAILTSRLIFSR